MLIGIKHSIDDPGTFWASAQANVPLAPAGLSPKMIAPGNGGSTAICIWEAQSLEQCRDFIEPLVREVSVNEYFVIDTASAVGL
jgi:hypothetical protein